VYSHFSHKGDLFLTLLEERIQQREVGNQGATARALDTAGALDFVRQGIAASLDPAWRLALLEFRVVAARDPELNARYALVHSYAIESVSTSLTAIYEQTGLTPPLPVEVLASTALAMEDGSFLEAVVRGESLPAETILALVARLFGFSAPTEEAP
jgi:AcrR family transcriptional regulator